MLCKDPEPDLPGNEGLDAAQVVTRHVSHNSQCRAVRDTVAAIASSNYLLETAPIVSTMANNLVA